jgi:ubiquinol-cytochrome c reductase iron-sulfur subunit
MSELDKADHHAPQASAGGSHAAPGAALHAAENPLAPGLPVHRPRRADVDPRATRRAERQVSFLFLVAIVLFIGFVVAYVVYPTDRYITLPVMGAVSASNFLLGLTLGVGLFCVGAGAIHWAKKLMPDVEEVDERHDFRGSDEERAGAVALFMDGVDQSGFTRFPMIRRTLIGALALSPVAAVVLLRDLGPMPGTKLNHTLWAKGVRIVTDVTLAPLKASDIVFGGLVSCVPANLQEVEERTGTLNARAKVPVILVRLRPDDIRNEQSKNWGYEGILCFSKICTHVGCPTALYEQQTHHLLCPCHQSTFDLADGGKVVFGPAARPMPQLAITVDADGYLVAQHDFTQPIGPSFWERS